MVELQRSLEIAIHCSYVTSPRLSFQLLARMHDHGGHYSSKVWQARSACCSQCAVSESWVS